MIESNKIARLTGFQEGLEEGKLEGLKMGLERGLLQGIYQGEYNKTIEIAKKMSSLKIDPEIIYRITGIKPKKLSEYKSC